MKLMFWSCMMGIGLLAVPSWGAEPVAAAKAPAAQKTEAPAATLAVESKEYALPEVGTLHLMVPKAWQVSFNKTMMMGSRVEELSFQPGNSKEFQVVVKAVHMKAGNAGEFETHAVLKEAADAELPTSEEKAADIHDFKGVAVTGSWVSLTDKNVSVTEPKPGEYKYLMMGYAKLDPLILSFRVVANRTNGEEKTAALEMIKSARLTADK